ncbi:MAG: alpha-ketoacid dehydrogenase subunit beta [Planctomycetota bacterium]|jgi:pyruvate dehydrogenase E1 component beta subunit|nr:alpha-ketoacid dehydrogenase subunit beta [Planctomycetota bacterium]
MSQITLVQAVNDALKEEMRSDNDVVVLGEDVGVNGGVFRCTADLVEEFGEERVIDTPLSESGIIGAAIGMAVYGLRPVPEIQFSDFIWPAFDQITSEMAKMRYRSGSQFTCPMVIRTPYGGGIRGGLYHSQSPEAYFTHTSGLTVVVPSDPYDAKGLLKAAIRSPDPVIFLEPKRIYRAPKMEVPEDDDYIVEIGKAAVRREGTDFTITAYGAMVEVALKACELAEKKGWNGEVLDLRTLVPLDEESLIASVTKTGRLVTLQEAPKFSGYSSELSAIVAEKAIDVMEAPIRRVAGFDVPFPYTLEHVYMPHAERVLKAVDDVMTF